MRTRLRVLLAASTTAVVVLGTGGTALAAPPTSAPTITSGPSGFSNQTTAAFTFSHSNAGSTFTCSLDGARASACTSPKTFTGLKAGAHTFAVRAIAPGLKQSKPVSRSWTVDLTAPNVPTASQPASPTKNTTASITFSSTSTDIASYLCSLDGATATTCTSPRALSGLAEGYHSFAVRAVDKAGNLSAARTVVWAVDLSAAAPFITGAPPSTSTGSVSFSFASDDSDVTFSCSMDSAGAGSYSACTSPRSYTGLSNGSHTFRVKATDPLGNVSAVTSHTWTVQNAPPITLAWSNPEGLPGAITHTTSGTFAFTASGQSTLTCLLDGVAQATCTSPESVSGLTDGTHTYSVVANSGLASQATLIYTWHVDTTAPGAPTINGPAARTQSTDANIAVVPAALGDQVTCTVDGSARACSAPFTLTGLADGGHNVTATSTDAAGNTSQSSFDWTVDTAGPDPTVTPPGTLAGPFTVTFDEDAGGVDPASVLVTDELGAEVATTRSCKTAASASTDCADTDVRSVKLTPTSPLVLGEHYRVQVNPVGAETVADDLGNLTPTVDEPVRVTSVSEGAAGGTFTWRKVKDRHAKGGSYLTEHLKGAAASWTFSGKAVTWYTFTGPTQGKAEVYVDGVRKATVNNYAKATKRGVARTVKGLAKGTHTVEIRALGKKGAKAGKGTFVVIDSFKVGRKVTTTPVVTNVRWSSASNASAAGSAYTVADLKAQTAKLVFRGTAFTLTTAKGRAYGKVSVSVDGGAATTVDLWAASSSWGVPVTVGGLTDARHTVVVKVLGTRNSKSTGTGVVIDGFSVS